MNVQVINNFKLINMTPLKLNQFFLIKLELSTETLTDIICSASLKFMIAIENLCYNVLTLTFST